MTASNTHAASIRAYLEKLTRDQLLADIESCERFGARLADERRPGALHAVQVANNNLRLTVAYDLLAATPIGA